MHLFANALLHGGLTEEEEIFFNQGIQQVENALKTNNPSLLLESDACFAQLYILGLTHANEFSALIASIRAKTPIQVLSQNKACLDAFWAATQFNRTRSLMAAINERKSLTHSGNHSDFVTSANDERKRTLYQNQLGKLAIDFEVNTFEFPCEVLDPRLVTVAPGKTNELHKHAHETIFVFLSGFGKVKIDEMLIPVKSGDFVFIPRWCMHQTINEADIPMQFLAVADFGLTGKSFTGNYLKTARLKESQ